MKKKILYVMHVDWNWIKQRPHFIEEHLEDEFDVVVLCPRNYRIKEYHDKQNIHVFYTIPFVRRFPVLWRIDHFRDRQFVRKYIDKEKPDIIYATHPRYGEYIPKSYEGKVLYDCMDDMLSFNKKSGYVSRISKQETIMMDRADIVLATSENLKAILNNRYPNSIYKTHLIRNGYDGKIAEIKQFPTSPIFTFCYFGTISHWFNFDYILKSLIDFPNIQYKLIGPIEAGTNIPQHERIMYRPPVKHDELLEATRDTDAFIMPFQLNDLILSVDPVKLYEYINFGKNILCVEYPEIKRFENFVYFYKDYESYKSQVKELITCSSTKYSEEDRLVFLSDNTWEKRTKDIVTLLNK